MSCAAVILAAGKSRRLGESKQNLRLGGDPQGETLLERAIRLAVEAGLAPVFVVTRAETARSAQGREIFWLVNELADEGVASSIRVGVEAARDSPSQAEGLVMMACDQPAVTAGHLRQLARGGEETVASAYAGRNGIPAYFSRSQFDSLLELRGDIGARALLRRAKTVELVGGEVDVDTPSDLVLARRLFS